MVVGQNKDNALVTIIGAKGGDNRTLVFETERDFAQFLTRYDKDKFVIFKVDVMPPLDKPNSYLIEPFFKY